MSTPVLYKNPLFAPLDADLHLQRIAGGNETEVYLSDDRRYVVKVKDTAGGTFTEAWDEVKKLHTATNEFHTVLGSRPHHPHLFYPLWR